MNRFTPFKKRNRLVRGPRRPGRYVFAAILALCLIAALGYSDTGHRTEGPAVQIPDTGQTKCYTDVRELSACPEPGSRFFGQDAQFQGPAMNYHDNGDGTVTDRVTGIVWSKAVEARKVSLEEAESMAAELRLGGYRDWRVPNIKELYSLINFSGRAPMMGPGQRDRKDENQAVPYINTDYFNFKYGKILAGERSIDAQWLSSTRYVSFTMAHNLTLFGVNFTDGRIKGYGYAGPNPRREKKFYVRFVRGSAYGENDFKANGDGTVTDGATGLTWARADSGRAMTWEEALAFARNSRLGSHSDWRLPNAKELQYIVDYTRSPDTTDSPAIDPIFSATPVTNEAGQKDFGHYWTSTTHLDGPRPDAAVTICFGRAMGKMHGRVMDLHGAGAQRSDPKSGGDSIGRGPQGDARHGKNFVRLVRGGQAALVTAPAPQNPDAYPAVIRVDTGYEAGQGDMAGNRMPGDHRMPPPPMGHPPGGRGFISRLDQDGDNRVSASEFDGPPDHFIDFDRNGDGFITEEEAPLGPPPGPPPGKWAPE